MNHGWNIVHFYNDGRVEVVPLTWLEAGSCSWPPYEKNRIATAIRECKIPAASWTQYPVKTITNATYDDYHTAKAAAIVAQRTLDTLSQQDKKERRKEQKRKRTGSKGKNIPTPKMRKINPLVDTISGSPTHGSTMHGSTMHGRTSRGSTTHGTTSRETTSRRTTARGSTTHGTTSRETTSRRTTSHGTTSRGTTSHGRTPPRSISHERTSPRSISHERISQRSISYRSISHGITSPRRISHERISERSISYRSISRERISHGITSQNLTSHSTTPQGSNSHHGSIIENTNTGGCCKHCVEVLKCMKQLASQMHLFRAIQVEGAQNLQAIGKK